MGTPQVWWIDFVFACFQKQSLFPNPVYRLRPTCSLDNVNNLRARYGGKCLLSVTIGPNCLSKGLMQKGYSLNISAYSCAEAQVARCRIYLFGIIERHEADDVARPLVYLETQNSKGGRLFRHFSRLR